MRPTALWTLLFPRAATTRAKRAAARATRRLVPVVPAHLRAPTHGVSTTAQASRTQPNPPSGTAAAPTSVAVQTMAWNKGAPGRTLTQRMAHPARRHHNAMTAVRSTATGWPMTPTQAMVVANRPRPKRYPRPAAARPVVGRTRRMSAASPGMTRIHQSSGWNPVPVAAPAASAARPRSHDVRERWERCVTGYPACRDRRTWCRGRRPFPSRSDTPCGCG